MTLTQKQVDTLYKFTAHQGVKYYDLQVELVDHLATGIEEEIIKNPELNPFEALLKVYGTFGKKGFNKLIIEKEKTLQKANTDKWLDFAKQYFTVPKIAFTALLFTLLYYVSAPLEPNLRTTVVQLCFVGCLFGQSFYLSWLWKDCKRKLLSTSFNSVFQFMGFTIPNFILFIIHDGIYSRLFFCSIMTTLLVLTVAAAELNQQLKAEAFKTYSDAFVAP